MNVSLKPPLSTQQKERDRMKVMRLRSFKLDDKVRQEVESKIEKMYVAWERNTSVLRRRLSEANDHLDGIVEDTDFPWPGASKVTTGLAAGHGRTLRAIFDRTVFPDHRPFAVESMGDEKSEDRNLLEIGANWLSRQHNNLVKELRNTPIPAFRDGTVPIMGDWKRRQEKVFEAKHYGSTDEFKKDYPDSQTAGITEDQYQNIISYVAQMDRVVSVEYQTDKVLYDGPWFEAFPLARLIWYPVVGVQELADCELYGRLYFTTKKKLKARAKREKLDDKIMESVFSANSKTHDAWGLTQDSIDGISTDEEPDLIKCARLVLTADLDGDDIPERYWIDYAVDSKKVFNIERYKLRNNVNCVILFRFLRRDGRLLGVSLLLDGIDGFKMVDSIHRHRNNVRALTDCPILVAPEALKDSFDLGSGPSAIRPGVTFWLEDRYLKEGMGPRQLPIQDLSRNNDSLDEETGVIRYLEFRIGTSMGLSGQESPNDPNAPGNKTISLMRQANARVGDLIAEWKNSVPEALELMSALYYLYGEDEYQVGEEKGTAGDTAFKQLKRQIWSYDKSRFAARHNEISLSPEFEMEKVMGLASIAAQNPILFQLKPEINLELWNDLVLASRIADPRRLLVKSPQQGQAGSDAQKFWAILGANNKPLGADLGAPTPAQTAAGSIAAPLNGRKGGLVEQTSGR